MEDFLELLTKSTADQKANSASRTNAPMLDLPVMAPPVMIQGGLDPYTGDWNHHTAKHLLQRAMFGPNTAQIEEAVSDGMEVTISRLFSPSPEPDLPINYNFNSDPFVPLGQPWVYEPISQNQGFSQRSIRAWQFGLVQNEGVNLLEKMVLFWHNHFVTSDGPHGKYIYQYIQLLRDNAFGNFRELVKQVTVNSLMLRYLNGDENNKNAPNENYARELLELFTIGKGEQAGPGDYTNYTEEDIKEIARALTGWTVNYPAFNVAGPHPDANFRTTRHDTGTKQLSARFGNAVIQNEGAEEYKTVVDIIFAQDEVSRFIARKLYRWFVYYHIDEDIETNVIEPLAAVLRDNDYEIRPAIEALLSSEHFYQENAIGCMIKSPIDFTVSLLKPFEVDMPFTTIQKYTIWYSFFGVNAAFQQEMFSPPSVAGWKAYYQDPIYYRNWINSVTLPLRRALSDGMALGLVNIFDQPWGIDPLKIVDKIPSGEDPNVLIQALVDLALPWPLTQNQLDALKEVLIPGLPDFEWTIEYGGYKLDPTNELLKTAVTTRLRLLFRAIFSLPEFQLQ